MNAIENRQAQIGIQFPRCIPTRAREFDTGVFCLTFRIRHTLKPPKAVPNYYRAEFTATDHADVLRQTKRHWKAVGKLLGHNDRVNGLMLEFLQPSDVYLPGRQPIAGDILDSGIRNAETEFGLTTGHCLECYMDGRALSRDWEFRNMKDFWTNYLHHIEKPVGMMQAFYISF